MVDFAKMREAKKGQIKLNQRWDCPPPGEHDAVCIDVLQFEAERFNKQGGKFTTQVIYIVWLVYPTDDRGNLILDSNGEPFKVDRQFNPTFAPGNKYGLHGIITDWAGRELSIQETNKFDLTSLIGKPCKLVVQTDQAKTTGLFYPKVLTAEPCANKTEFWIKAETYKPRDYTEDLKARDYSKSGQTQQEETPNSWRPEGKTDDSIPF